MADKTAIQWTDATWNPVTGCTRVSPGCANCYIERTPPFRMEGRRFARAEGSNESTTGVRLHPDRLNQPIRWRNPRRVFVCSLADLFHEQVPDDYLDTMFGVMAGTRLRGMDGFPGHTFQVLTKRPERALEYLSAPDRLQRIARAGAQRFEDGDTAHDFILDQWPIPNVWVGVSIESARYTYRADLLREIPAAVRFVSAEPLLGSLFDGDRPGVCGTCNHSTLGHGPNGCDHEVRDYGEMDCGCERRFAKPLDLTSIDWIIVGGESGPGARPMQVEWAREIIRASSALCDSCHAFWQEHPGSLPPACTGRPALFVKQLGAKPIIGREELAATCSVAVECEHGYDVCPECDAGETELPLTDRKGGDWDEWPADLRIREFPTLVGVGAAA